jgi:hypothetical protein
MVFYKGEEGSKDFLHIPWIWRCNIHSWLWGVWIVVCCGTNQSICGVRHLRFVLDEWHGSWGIR